MLNPHMGQFFQILAMIRHCFMHHSYTLRGVDEKQNYFSPQYEHKLHLTAIMILWKRSIIAKPFL